MRKEGFTEKFGAVYEGLFTDKRSVLIFPMLFIIRRAIFAFLCLMMYDLVIIQMIVMLAMTVFVAIYVINYAPFEDPLLNKLEVMNELTNMMAIDIFFCLTDLAKSQTKADKLIVNDILATMYITLMALNVTVHLTIMARGTIRDCKLVRQKKKWDKWLKALPEDRRTKIEEWADKDQAYRTN
jgi:hypothetical protein